MRIDSIEFNQNAIALTAEAAEGIFWISDSELRKNPFEHLHSSWRRWLVHSAHDRGVVGNKATTLEEVKDGKFMQKVTKDRSTPLI